MLSPDSAWLLQLSRSGSDPILAAQVGWPDQPKGEPVAGEARSLSGYASRSGRPVLVEDWERSGASSARANGLRTACAAASACSSGDPDTPFGMLEVQYGDPSRGAGGVPPVPDRPGERHR